MPIIAEMITLQKPNYGDPPQETPIDYTDFTGLGAGRIDKRSDIGIQDEITQVAFETTFQVRLLDEIRDVVPGWLIVDWYGDTYRVVNVRKPGGVKVSQARISLILLDCDRAQGVANV